MIKRYCFAHQVLKRKGVTIYYKDNLRVLHNYNHIYDTKPLDHKIMMHDIVVDPDDIRIQIIDSIEILREQFQFVIVTEKPKIRWERGQQVQYKLIRFKKGVTEYNKAMPPNHHVEYDFLHNMIRIRGPKAGPTGVGEWMETIFTRVRTKKDSYYLKSTVYKSNFQEYLNTEAQKEYIHIKEIPILITHDNKIVCLKINKDLAKIGVVGKTGSGKTMCAHGIIDNIYYKRHEGIFIANDSQFQVIPWTLPAKSILFQRQHFKINANPLPLPCVFFYPTNQYLDNRLLTYKHTFPISLSFQQLIRNYAYFLKGKPEWELGKSLKILQDFQDDLLACENLDDVWMVLEPLKSDKSLKQSYNKIKFLFGDLFRENFLNISSGVPNEWTFRKDNYFVKKNPIIALMELGLIPTLITNELKNKHYFLQYMKVFLEEIFYYQIQKVNKKPLWLFVDEIGDLYRVGKRNTLLAEILEDFAGRGRQHQLGMIYTIQNYSTIAGEIRKNTNYVIALNTGSSKERNELGKDFGLDKATKERIGRLKPFEAIVMSSDKPFIIYTADGDKYEEDGVFEGKIIFPTSEHKAPGAQL